MRKLTYNAYLSGTHIGTDKCNNRWFNIEGSEKFAHGISEIEKLIECMSKLYSVMVKPFNESA